MPTEVSGINRLAVEVMVATHTPPAKRPNTWKSRRRSMTMGTSQCRHRAPSVEVYGTANGGCDADGQHEGVGTRHGMRGFLGPAGQDNGGR